MQEPVICVENASVRFNLGLQRKMSTAEYMKSVLRGDLLMQEFYALRDISLTVRKGESWALVGRNGSGKSTLLKLISGILRPQRGSVTVHGSIAPLLELGAGFDPELTGRENIYMNGLILGMSNRQIDAALDDIISFSEMEGFMDVPLKNYSSGMRSRLGFAIATSAKPDILIADEVLSTGDRAFQEKSERRMKSLLSNGTTLLFVSHSPGAVRSLCRNTAWLDAGRMRMQGTTEDVMNAYEMYTKMGLG